MHSMLLNLLCVPVCYGVRDHVDGTAEKLALFVQSDLTDESPSIFYKLSWNSLCQRSYHATKDKTRQQRLNDMGEVFKFTSSIILMYAAKLV